MNPRLRVSRREWLSAMAAAGLSLPHLLRAAETSSRQDPSKLGIPGLYPGRVASVSHKGCLVDNAFQAEPIRHMIEEGMVELTGAPDATSAWRQFFETGDVVGIKLTPVGGPLACGSPEVLREIIRGLESAGVRRKDIVVYDRYRDQFLKIGFDKWLPEGVRWSSASQDYDHIQQDMEGYDAEHYVDFPVVLPGQDPNNEAARRSYAARFITQEVTKLVNVPILKTHQSAGVTLALKNLSHGLVNNVNRSHATTTMNVCGAFIPAMVAMPVIRNKTVLHILDGIRGLFDGGPSARKEFVWEHRTLYFSTDPVAIDRTGWAQIEKQRAVAGLKPILEAQPDKASSFAHRQLEHIEIAGALGLGTWDEKKLDVRKVTL